MSSGAQAALITTPTSGVAGVRLNTTTSTLDIATTGTDGGATTYTDNFFPAAEPPSGAIDGTTDKYLNFAELNTGILVTSTLGPQVARQMSLWVANDAAERDPASYQIYGTNSAVSLTSSNPIASFTLIASGSLALPTARNTTIVPVASSTNFQTVNFANNTAYASYAVIFPTVRTETSANSMQVGEVQLDTVPEPGSVGLAGVAVVGMLARRRRRAAAGV